MSGKRARARVAAKIRATVARPVAVVAEVVCVSGASDADERERMRRHFGERYRLEQQFTTHTVLRAETLPDYQTFIDDGGVAR